VIIPVRNIYLRENIHLRLSALNALIGRVDFSLEMPRGMYHDTENGTYLGASDAVSSLATDATISWF
jgi:hypothetical protein